MTKIKYFSKNTRPIYSYIYEIKIRIPLYNVVNFYPARYPCIHEIQISMRGYAVFQFYFSIILREIHEDIHKHPQWYTRSSYRFSVDFSSVRLSWKVSVHICLWGSFWNRIVTLHILSWISVTLSQEYLVHLNWIKLASKHCGLDGSTCSAADGYPESESSNPARVNVFQLTSEVSDYHEKFLLITVVMVVFLSKIKH